MIEHGEEPLFFFLAIAKKDKSAVISKNEGSVGMATSGRQFGFVLVQVMPIPLVQAQLVLKHSPVS